MTKIIAYDKDGTLLNYEKIWTPYAKKCFRDFEAHFDLEYDQNFRENLGLVDGVIVENSLLASGTGEIIQNAFESRVRGGARWTLQYYEDHMTEFPKYMELLPGAIDALLAGHSGGYLNAIITSDSRQSTEVFIGKYNLENLVDFVIAGDDGNYAKPDVRVLNPLIEAGFQYEDIVVVGDNSADTLLGINEGVRTIGVLSGTSTSEYLDGATTIVNGVGDLFVNGEFILK